MPTETLYVNSFSVASIWNSHAGVSPYLQQADGNSSTAFTDHIVEDVFGFANTAIADFATITSIKLKGQVKTDNEFHYCVCQLHGSAGGAWSISGGNWYGDGNPLNYINNTSVDLKATINSLARINECLSTNTKHNAVGVGNLTLRQVYLEITYAVAGAAVLRRLLVGVGL